GDEGVHQHQDRDRRRDRARAGRQRSVRRVRAGAVPDPARWVAELVARRLMDEIHFVDTTIRDGHQSLWAERMSTGMMLPIAKNHDDASFLAIELLSGSLIKKAVRELREDPWERIKRVAQLAPKTPLRLIAGRVNTFGFDPPCM